VLRPATTANAQSLHTPAWLQWAIDRYARGLQEVLNRPLQTLAVFALTVVMTVALYVWMPKGFFPVQDTGAVQVITEATQSTSFVAMSQRQQALAAVLLKDPAVQSLSSFIGVDGPNTTLNTGRMTLNLVPKSQRDAPLADILQRLSQSADGISGMHIYLQPLQDLSLEDRVARTQYRFLLSGPDSNELGIWSQRLLAQLRQHPALAEVASDFQDQGLQAYVRIDRDAASRLGVSVMAIDNALYNAFGQRLVSTIFTQSNQYRVVLEVSPQERMGPQALARLTVPSVSGAQVPLSSVATIEERATLLSQVHVNQFPAVTLSFQPSEKTSLGEAVAAIDQTWQKMREQDKVPDSIESRFEGAALAFQASLSHSLWLVLAAVVTMYIVLGVLYESYVHPVTILSTLPSAALGALLALWLARLDISLIAVIGIILLIGIVKKNAIMMIDFALDAERNQGLSPRQAIEQACLLRFRPILMTTLCALLGALPLMLGTGVGSELRHPLGVTLVGGLIVSQWLTLFTTPVIYLLLGRWSQAQPAADSA
jgi:multidrug efflux pump